MMTWWFTTFMAPAIKHKVHSLPGVEYLYEIISRDDLEIPAFITEHDMTVRSTSHCDQYIHVNSQISFVWTTPVR